MADSFRTNGKRAQTIRMINAAAARRFPATSRAGRAAPATCGKRVPSADEGVVKRGHACAQSRRRYSLTGPPAGSTSESAGRDRWPPPSDRVIKRSYEKNESVIHATPLTQTLSRGCECWTLRCECDELGEGCKPVVDHHVAVCFVICNDFYHHFIVKSSCVSMWRSYATYKWIHRLKKKAKIGQAFFRGTRSRREQASLPYRSWMPDSRNNTRACASSASTLTLRRSSRAARADPTSA